MKANIKTARRIIESFSIDVYDFPEYLSEEGKYCERNKLVAEVLLAIDKLQESI